MPRRVMQLQTRKHIPTTFIPMCTSAAFSSGKVSSDAEAPGVWLLLNSTLNAIPNPKPHANLQRNLNPETCAAATKGTWRDYKGYPGSCGQWGS